MKILIDMQGMQTPFSSGRGVGVYIESLVRELHKIRSEHELHFLFNAEFSEEYVKCCDRLKGIVDRQNSHLFAQQIINGYFAARDDEIVAAETFVGAFIESIDPDVVFSPNLQEGLHDRAVCTFAARNRRFVQIATLHDMVPMYLEAEYLSDPRTKRWYSRKIQDAVKCDRIITVSDASKRDIERFVGISSEKIESIPNGYDSKIFNPIQLDGESSVIREFLGDNRGYILYFGGADDHKNIVRLIEAYALLSKGARDRFPLVLGGRDMVSATKILSAIKSRDLEHQVLMPGFIPQRLLPALIRQATLFVFPSTHEGFGLPPLEAMACGTPTIASEASAIGEVVANAEAAFDPLNVPQIAARIHKALTDLDWRESLRTTGLERAAEFSWQTSAMRLKAVMEAEHRRHKQSGRLSFISKRVANAIPSQASDLARSVAITIAETVPSRTARHVYIDVSSTALYGGNSGIQRVVREMARYLPEAFVARGVQVEIVYAPEGTTNFRALGRNSDGSFASVGQADEVIDFAPSDVLLFLDLHPGLAIRMEHQIQRIRALGVSVFHVVYDILPVLMPEKFWPDLQQEFYRWLQCISRSDGLLCISRTVATQVVEYLNKYGVERSDLLFVGYFPLGCDFKAVSGSPNATCEITHLGPEGLGPNFLMVGTLEPRKAHEQVLRAFEQAWEDGENWRLIIVGRQGWKMDRLGQYIREHPELGRRLDWYENAGDDVLHQIYLAADCILCASEGEGFGLPLIEAAQAGKPVIARDIPVFREVAKQAATYFDDERTPESVRRAIERWILANERGTQPKSDGMSPISWRKAAAELASAIEAPKWPFMVQASGLIDLANPVCIASSNLRRSGFYPEEGSFAWTAERASIEFQTAEDYETISVELECFSWKRMPFHISINGQQVFAAVANATSDIHHFTAKGLRRGKNRIAIVSESAGSPDDDARLLGLAVKRLDLVARLPIKPGQWLNVRDLNVQWEGFSQVEFDWRWSTSETSQIKFALADALSDAVISLYCRGSRPFDTTFLLNGKILETRKLPVKVGTLDLPPADLKQGENVLEIRIADVSPFSTSDRRKLGVTVLELCVGLPQDVRNESTSQTAESLSA